MRRQAVTHTAMGLALLVSLMIAVGVRQAGGATIISSAIVPAQSCLGPRDLIVQNGQLTLHGIQTFDRVCLHQGGVLVADAPLTLLTGALFIDASSHITADGLPGGLPSGMLDCRGSGTGTPDGGPGSALTILARQAIEQGSISSSGGQGLRGSEGMCSSGNGLNGGNGGNGGQISIWAKALTLHAPIIATGGAGGVGGNSTSLTENGGNGGNGGSGGTLSLRLGQQAPATLMSYLHAEGGTAGVLGQAGCSSGGGCTAQPGMQGSPGGSGSISVGKLTPAQIAILPPSPPPLQGVIGLAPARQSPQPTSTFRQGMSCGTGDLNVGPGVPVTLTGIHHYTHVCVHDGGTLLAGAGVTLQAKTILVDSTSRLLSDGTVASSGSHLANGRYESAGPCTHDHSAPHSGIPGAAGFGDPANGIPGATGGTAGGTVSLVAHRVLLAGFLAARGASGKRGMDAGCSPSGCIGPFSGGGGGSGGGIRIVATEVQLTGSIAPNGGASGSGGSLPAPDIGVADEGLYGGPGCVKIFVDTLRAPAGQLPVTGPVLIGHTTPADPPH